MLLMSMLHHCNGVWPVQIAFGLKVLVVGLSNTIYMNLRNTQFEVFNYVLMVQKFAVVSHSCYSSQWLSVYHKHCIINDDHLR